MALINLMGRGQRINCRLSQQQEAELNRKALIRGMKPEDLAAEMVEAMVRQEQERHQEQGAA